jgi:hypothetical protein
MIRSPMLVYVRARDADILGIERGRHSGTRAPIPDLGGLPASNTRSDTLRRRWLKVIFDVPSSIPTFRFEPGGSASRSSS